MVPAELLKGAELFAGVSDETLRKIGSLCREETYEAGSTILRENDEAQDVYILEEGAVAIRIAAPPHGDVIVGTARGKGEIFGWSALVEPRRFTATVRCLDRSKVFIIKGHELLDLLEKDPRVGFTVMRNLAGVISSRLRDIRAQLRSVVAQGRITAG